MSLLVKGVSRWSQITIDADKDMLGFGLTDLEQMVAGMTQGDMIYYNGALNRLVVIQPSPIIGEELLTKGVGHAPEWGFPDTG